MPKMDLEADNYRSVDVVIEELQPAAGAIGLTKDTILTHVELKLRQSGLRPEKRTDYSFLYVQVSVSGAAFSHSIGI